MRTTIKAVAFAAMALWFTGCATVKLKRPELDNVKTIALVGYTGTIDLSHSSDKGTSTGFGAITNAIKDGATGDETATRRKDQADKAYGLLWKAVGEATGWTLLERAAIEANPEYAKLVQANPSGEGQWRHAQVLPTVVRADVIEQLEPARRTELVKALGVDAVAFVKVRYVVANISGVSIGGMGRTEKHPKAIVELKLYDAATPEPLWAEIRAEGQAAEAGIARTMGIDSDENETAAMLEAATTAFATLGDHYKEAKAKPPEK